MSHASIDPVKVTIKRVWNDLSRKLLAFLAGGLTGSALVAGLDYLGVHLEPALASTIVVVVASVAGYIKKEVAVLDSSDLPKPELTGGDTFTINNPVDPEVIAAEVSRRLGRSS